MGEKKNCELLFLGTGAADWNGPEADGSLRRFSCALVNGHILIDCPSTRWIRCWPTASVWRM